MTEYPELKAGLAQIPKAYLPRLKRALEDENSPLVFDGEVCTPDGWY